MLELIILNDIFMQNLKFISWNVNGIRAAVKKGLFEFFKAENPDFLCLQETKAHEDQLPFEIKVFDDYTTYFVSGEKKGYSGVATYAKEVPMNISKTIDSPLFDVEGRHVILEYEKFFLLNVYFPNGRMNKERLQYKLDYYSAFLKFVTKLKEKGKAIIICGDVNTAHQEIDLFHPKTNAKNSGFLPEEREWIDELLALGFTDTFRHFNKEPNQYTWWDQRTRARDRDIGWRIDYFFIDNAHLKNVTSASIYKEVMGSDHCPIAITLTI